MPNATNWCRPSTASNFVQLLPLSGDGFFQGDVDLFAVAHKVSDVLPGFLRFSCPVPQWSLGSHKMHLHQLLLHTHGSNLKEIEWINKFILLLLASSEPWTPELFLYRMLLWKLLTSETAFKVSSLWTDAEPSAFSPSFIISRVCPMVKKKKKN